MDILRTFKRRIDSISQAPRYLRDNQDESEKLKAQSRLIGE